MITRAAVIASSRGQSGQNTLESLKQNMRDEDGNIKPLPAFWTQMMRQWIERQLRESSDIRYPSDGLPDDQILNVNGRAWAVEEAFEYVRPGLFAQDIERALAEVVIREALRQELEKTGHLIGLDEFKMRWEIYAANRNRTALRAHATLIAGYPCLEAYRQRWRLISSFRDLIAEEITDENLLVHGEKFKPLFGDGRVSLDLIPFMGKDPSTGAWRADGMEDARKRADAAFQLLEDGELTFEEVEEQYAEFLPTNEDRGVLAYKPINQVRRWLGESDFTDLLQGYGVSNYLFYEAELGEAVGPLRGPDAYYIARVNVRTPPYKKVDLTDANKRMFIEQDYVIWRFLQWANGILVKAVIE